MTCWHPPPSCPEEQEATAGLLEMLETALVDQRCWCVCSARTKAVGISPPAGRGINHPIHSSRQSLCGCAYVKSGYELFTAGFPRCSSAGVVQSVGHGARQSDVCTGSHPPLSPELKLASNVISVSENQGISLFWPGCAAEIISSTHALCSENPPIPPGSLPDFSHIYTLKTPKKFMFVGLKFHNASISYWLLIPSMLIQPSFFGSLIDLSPDQVSPASPGGDVC